MLTKEEVLEKLNEVFRDVFDNEKIVVNENTTADDIDEWDSLEHIRLVDAVEAEFNMNFSMKEVSSMKNVGEMAEIVAQRAKPKAEKKKRRGFFGRG
jgi:acyl carrier protein